MTNLLRENKRLNGRRQCPELHFRKNRDDFKSTMWPQDMDLNNLAKFLIPLKL